MTKIERVKLVSGLVISIGVGAIVNNAIKCTTPESIRGIKKICVFVGAIALGSMLSDAATTHADKKIDKTVDQIKEMVKEAKTEEINENEKDEPIEG